MSIPMQPVANSAAGEPDEEEWGCEYCRNDGKLTPSGMCPRCDSQYPDE